jgi:hypothetical protein
VLTFAGKPTAALVLTYKDALLELFPKFFNLIQNDSLKKFMVHGVPYVRAADGSLPTSDELFTEFRRNNGHLQKWGLSERPTWTRGAILDCSKMETSFSFLLTDPHNTANRILRTPCYIYGKVCTIKAATSYVQHRQCQWCFLLTHNIDTCPCPDTYKRCGICGKSGHTKSEHNSAHCGCNHASIPCDCSAKCFNCFFYKKPSAGHYAFSDECPLKKNMHRYASEPIQPAPATAQPTSAATIAPLPTTL